MVQQAISIVYLEVYLGYKLAGFPGGDYTQYLLDISNEMSNARVLAWISLLYSVICIVWFGVWYYRLKYNVPREEGHGPAVVRDRAVEVANRQRGLFEGYSWTIIPGIILIVFTLFSLINQGPLFFFYYYADEGLVSTLVSMAVEATVLFAELDLVISAINVRRIENAA